MLEGSKRPKRFDKGLVPLNRLSKREGRIGQLGVQEFYQWAIVAESGVAG